MAQQHKVFGYDDLIDCVNRLKTDNKPINVYFTGSKDDSGKSWCPDCVEALPFIEKAVAAADPNTHFIYCDVGDRPLYGLSEHLTSTGFSHILYAKLKHLRIGDLKTSATEQVHFFRICISEELWVMTMVEQNVVIYLKPSFVILHFPVLRKKRR